MNESFLSQAVFKTRDIEHLFPSERSMQNRLKSLMEENRVARIKNGLYATVNPITGSIFANRYEIGTALVPDGYIGYHSALEFFAYGNQMFSEVQVFSKKRTAPFIYEGLEYRFYNPPIDGGILLLERNGEIRVTNIERTVVDCIDRLDLCGGIEEVVIALGEIHVLDEKVVLSYLNTYDKKSLFQKAGFLLSAMKKNELSPTFFEECRLNVPNRVCDIRENRKLPYSFSKEWNLLYNDSSMELEN